MPKDNPPPKKQIPVLNSLRFTKNIEQSRRLKSFLNQYRENEQIWAYTETTLTIFLIAVFVFFAIRPAVITVTGLLSEIKAKEELVLKIRKKINSVVQAQDSYSQVQSRHKILEAFLPDNPRYTHTAAQVQGVSQDSNLSISKINFTIKDGNQKSKNLSKTNIVQSNIIPVAFSTNTAAEYQDFLVFLNQLLKNRRLITPQTLSLSRPKDTRKENAPEEGQILINLKGSSFFWNE